jgi:hypothetical protein
MPSLPMGGESAPPVYSNIPPYLNQHNQSIASTGSIDSFATQVPLPYHLPQERQYQPLNFIPQNTPWATPVFPQNGQFYEFPHHGSGNRKLNPASASYVPSNYGQGASFNSQSSYTSYGDFSHPRSMSSVGSSYPQMDTRTQQGFYQEYQYPGAQGMSLTVPQVFSSLLAAPLVIRSKRIFAKPMFTFRSAPM